MCSGQRREVRCWRALGRSQVDMVFLLLLLFAFFVHMGKQRAAGSLVAFRAAPKYQFILSFGRVIGPLGDVPNGLEGTDKAGLEVQVMSQIMGD